MGTGTKDPERESEGTEQSGPVWLPLSAALLFDEFDDEEPDPERRAQRKAEVLATMPDLSCLTEPLDDVPTDVRLEHLRERASRIGGG